MPVVSEKQKKFMQAISHGMKPRGGVGPSPEVAKEMLSGKSKKLKTKKS